jgi:hypothetical protein
VIVPGEDWPLAGTHRGHAGSENLLQKANETVSRTNAIGHTQAVNSNKRAAQSKLVKMIVSDVGQRREEKYPAIEGLLDLIGP